MYYSSSPVASRRHSASQLATAARTQLSRLSVIAPAVHSQVAAGMQRIDGVGEVVQQCTGVLLDQFGVLHDGKVPYPNAVAAVERLADAGKQIIVLSNSSRRSGGTIGKLVKMGFKQEWFTGSSGRLPHDAADCLA